MVVLLLFFQNFKFIKEVEKVDDDVLFYIYLMRSINTYLFIIYTLHCHGLY